ncbi:MAG TPA: Crp/Fnr family transcriptional regulator [Solirubrobacteraceae bacterium]|nr:Crp/Fnr family transcriptional regulator [Solirubrobacteraceae bacterium]
MGEPSFLETLSAEQAETLGALGRGRRYATGAALFIERDPADAVLILRSGRVKLSCVTDAGREAVLGIREPGDLIGEMSAIDDAPHMATARALEPVEVLAVSSDAFVAFLERTPGVALVLVRMLNRRLRDADRKRTEFVAQDTVGRVCSRLVELADRFGEDDGASVHIDLTITQEELAGWTGSSREAVIRALRTLRELGWIATRRRGITLLDVEALRHRGV